MVTGSGVRRALLIATDRHEDAAFRRLRAPSHDAAALRDVLVDPEIGGYEVEVLRNVPAHRLRVRLDEFFARAERDDLVLLYISGHGVKDRAGRLNFVATDTRHDLLASTAVTAEFVRVLTDQTRAQRVVLLLDCCFGGAFPAGVKGGGDVDVLEQLAREGRGWVVMTASTRIQFAYEQSGDELRGKSEPSLFTGAVVEGLRTGEADLGGDGVVDTGELFDFVRDRVRARSGGSQTPTSMQQVDGPIHLCRAPSVRTRSLAVVPPGVSASSVAPESAGGLRWAWFAVVAVVFAVVFVVIVNQGDDHVGPTGATSSSAVPTTAAATTAEEAAMVRIEEADYLGLPAPVAMDRLVRLGVVAEVRVPDGYYLPLDEGRCMTTGVGPRGLVAAGSKVAITVAVDCLGKF
ncbi:hypothetical protein BJP25_23710 [Actinokineospora bangkokensis]|uniref:Peptidase C14 caspase domain-containing protein n=1 Tax=Actinokineospora bangkokensis TaxID=1193682 RepID=A0A1Q9LII9_9PSEU|nr:caspase family protein [Actinokineospora bangkokensis]OLR91848.1 hypothetical protein BJP25_23710 [Actinokineospora bangkokensis]